MKAFYRLLNYEFGELLKEVLIICGGLIVTTLIFIQIELTNYNSFTVHERYEDIFRSSGGPIIFLVFLVLLLALYVIATNAPYMGSRSIYTFLTLPVKRELLYFSKLTAFLIGMLMLLAAQLISYRLGYGIMMNKIEGYADGQYVMMNGLFLSLIRSDFMQMLWPSSLLGITATVSVLVTLVTGLYYVLLCERSKKRWGNVLIVLAFNLISRSVLLRIEHIDSFEIKSIIIVTVLLFIFNIVFIWHSLSLIKKGAVA